MYNSPDNFPFSCLGIIFAVIGRSVRAVPCPPAVPRPSSAHPARIPRESCPFFGSGNARPVSMPAPLEFRRGLTGKATELFALGAKVFPTAAAVSSARYVKTGWKNIGARELSQPPLSLSLSLLHVLFSDERKARSLLILRPHKLICKAARSICPARSASAALVRGAFYPRRTDGNPKRKQKYKGARRTMILTEVSRSESLRRAGKCLPPSSSLLFLSLSLSLAGGLSNRVLTVHEAMESRYK